MHGSQKCDNGALCRIPMIPGCKLRIQAAFESTTVCEIWPNILIVVLVLVFAFQVITFWYSLDMPECNLWICLM